MAETPIRLPDAATIAALLKDLDPTSADDDLAPALCGAFYGFAFSIAAVDDAYWRETDRCVIDADGARLGGHDAWVERELATLGGDPGAFWNRYRDSGLKISEWRGQTVFGFAPTGPGAADFVQLALHREIEVVAGPMVDPGYRPWRAIDLHKASWIRRDPTAEAPVLSGPVYRLRERGGLVHMRRFLDLCQRVEGAEREARRPEIEARVIHEVGPGYERETSFLKLNPNWFDFVPRENRFLADWERSSAAAHRIFDHWAFDIRDFEERGRRELGFIPQPLKMPAERLLADESLSVHRLMERIEAIDAEVGLPLAWFFLMTHGQWVDPDVGAAIAKALRAARVRLPDGDATVVLEWADNQYLF